MSLRAAHLLPTAVVIAVLVVGGCGEPPARRTEVSAPAAIPQPAAPAPLPVNPPFLGLPAYSHEAMPSLLSQTGVFSDTATLTPIAGLLPYEVCLLYTSDAADEL